MQAETLEVASIRYNPEFEGFEATLRIHDKGEVFAYPVQVRAPLDADYAIVARGLSQKGLAVHAGRGKGLGLRSRRLTTMQLGAIAA